MHPMDAVAALWTEAAMPADALDDLTLTGADPVLPSSFAIGAAAQASIALSALAAAAIWRQRTGRRQGVAVDMRHAAAEFRSERALRVNGAAPADPWDRIAGAYPSGDGRWVRLHTNFPHHRDGVLALLGCAYDRDAVTAALRGWRAFDFEQAAADAGMVVAAQRSFAEWDAHPQGRAVAAQPTVSITRIGDAPPSPLPAAPLPKTADRPLSGLRVLELTRVIAGPVCGRTLAAHGADVLLLTSPTLPAIPTLVIDTGRGKRSAHLDLRSPHGVATMRDLVRGADIVVQGYRPGAIAGLGFAPDDAARLRPRNMAGIVYVSLSAYGPTGPWAGRRGFDSLVQTASGFNAAEAEAAGIDTPQPLAPQPLPPQPLAPQPLAPQPLAPQPLPPQPLPPQPLPPQPLPPQPLPSRPMPPRPLPPRPLPAQALDHASGFLLAFGALAALHRRATEGGSWHVEISLARTGQWIRGLGRVPDGLACPDPTQADIADLLDHAPSGFGHLSAVRHAARLTQTPPHWARMPVPLGADPAAW